MPSDVGSSVSDSRNSVMSFDSSGVQFRKPMAPRDGFSHHSLDRGAAMRSRANCRLRRRSSKLKLKIPNLADVSTIDKWSRVIFPIVFGFFNLIYWLYYVNWCASHKESWAIFWEHIELALIQSQNMYTHIHVEDMYMHISIYYIYIHTREIWRTFLLYKVLIGWPDCLRIIVKEEFQGIWSSFFLLKTKHKNQPTERQTQKYEPFPQPRVFGTKDCMIFFQKKIKNKKEKKKKAKGKWKLSRKKRKRCLRVPLTCFYWYLL